MISRYILIVLAFGVAIYRAVEGAYLASAGLVALGAGLVVLKLSEGKPRLRPLAYICFAATAVAIAIMLLQRR